MANQTGGGMVTHTFIVETNTGPVARMFKKPTVASTKRPLAVLIPGFNEPVSEFWHSLMDLHVQQQSLETAGLGLELHVVKILDGWDHVSESEKAFLVSMFPPNERADGDLVSWLDAVDRAVDSSVRPRDERDNIIPFTVVVTRTLANDPEYRPQPVNLRKPSYVGRGDNAQTGHSNVVTTCNLTLVIKADNRKKANSHKYFLADDVGFAAAIGAEYVFLTDAGTRFYKDCMLRLVQYLADRPLCAAVTGRQRVMSTGKEETDDGCLSVSMLGRISNLCNYEGSFAIFNGAFALFGLLPVIPGPCGLFRLSFLRGEPINFYLGMMEKPAETKSQLTALSHLAEDRSLPFAILTKGSLPKPIKARCCCGRFVYIGLEPRATFLFQQEPTFDRWTGQMRRWTAGTAAFYLDVLANHSPLIIKSKRMAWPSKLALFAFYTMQVALYFLMAMTPSLFLVGVWRALGQLKTAVISNGMDDAVSSSAQLASGSAGIIYPDTLLASDVAFAAAWIAVALLYLAFVYMHNDRSTKPIKWMFAALGVLGTMTVAYGVASFAVHMVSAESPTAPSAASTFAEDAQWAAAYTVVFSTIAPIVIAFCYSPYSAFLLVVSLPLFTLLIPLTVGLFGTYAFSRLSDLSWGSRENTDDLRNQETTQANYDSRSRVVAAMFVVLNSIVTIIGVATIEKDVVISVTVFVVFGLSAVHAGLSLIYAAIHVTSRWLFLPAAAKCCHDRRVNEIERQYYDGRPVNHPTVGNRSVVADGDPPTRGTGSRTRRRGSRSSHSYGSSDGGQQPELPVWLTAEWTPPDRPWYPQPESLPQPALDGDQRSFVVNEEDDFLGGGMDTHKATASSSGDPSDGYGSGYSGGYSGGNSYSRSYS